ncbi:TolC family protein [Dyadobacter fanqingshengii]|uniref:TolC family protein n=1 Tax=Dyadobacter fanqingshengii TaxID=2906443 RepID=A0A9X1PEN3_9BACT|nr:TolC family protein [Dyadobacter fanqingshengii]MCF0041862.1 TolC family protein [Dyadobacter fanqingshengii]MCF2504911.1 TolC family protein [Dyadobacter fanqingshengii]USJ36429.1 TolC family protein [Dyadobacter fanqingshengii]
MRYAVFLIPLFLITLTTHAQESLSKDVDYAYLEKLITITRANYPKIKMYDDRVTVAEYAIKKAKLSYFDIFNFSYLYSPNNNTATISPTLLSGYQLGFFVNIGAILQKPSLIKQAKGELSVMQHDKEAFDLNMVSEVKKRYFTLIQKRAVFKVRSNAVLDVESMVANVKKRFEMGQETLEKYNQILVMQTDHYQNLLNAESEILIAKSSLEELLGQKLEDIK